SMLNALKNIDMAQILTFMIGAVLGAFTISRVISSLFKKDKCKTLYFLLGLVLGCLSIPVKKISITEWNTNMFAIISLIVLGIISVLLVNKFAKK
ncbi:MAG: DUF368 domain-containing protein, partial [Nanoarchaeota archaeon]